MRTVLFVWRRYTPPFLVGGAEVSQQLLAEEFASAGWQVIYLGSHEAPWNGTSDLARMRPQLGQWGVPHACGKAGDELRYRWHAVDCRALNQASLFEALRGALRATPPELVVTSQEGSAVLATIARRTAPVAGWIHSVSRTGMEVLQANPRVALATSRFVLSRMSAPRGTKPLLFYPPFIRQGSGPVPADGVRPDDLLMINPVPAKGARLVRELALRLPERRFTLVEGWWDSSPLFTGLTNVQYVKRTYKVRQLYQQHRLLLVPSVLEDAFPRVIIEAGLTGLPSIGSARGGIAEAIQDGGLVVPSSDVVAWARAIHSLDGAAWRDRARRALERSSRLVRSCLAELTAAGVIAAT